MSGKTKTPDVPIDEAKGAATRTSKDKAKVDHIADHVAYAQDRDEGRLDEGIEESFPASDPVSAKHIT
jgi:hypothetical protein